MIVPMPMPMPMPVAMAMAVIVFVIPVMVMRMVVRVIVRVRSVAHRFGSLLVGRRRSDTRTVGWLRHGDFAPPPGVGSC
ncbi:hypothetical protein J2852_000466 [Azospirillum soli]|nr:hypothetical protein [Azospirillum soli]